MRRTVQRGSLQRAITAFCAAFFLLILSPGPAAQSSEQQTGSGGPQIAPMNPEFLKYLAEQGSNGSEPESSARNGGWIPLSIKLPPPATPLLSAPKAMMLPSRFDLRSSHPVGVTEVKDQNQCGACWAFAAMASLESHFRYKKGKILNFSEAHLNENHGFNSPVCQGGNWKMATAYLARWSGPVTEANAPYPYFFGEQSFSMGAAQSLSAEAGPILSYGTAANPGGSPVAYHVQNVYFLPQAGKPLTTGDIATLKQAIYDDGAVAVSYFSDARFYNEIHHSYFCDEDSYTTHAVAIVGWDDSYPGTNFNSQAPANGAFIIKSSSGKSWGEGGYFYMSYYDKSLEIGAQFYNAEPVSKYAHIYQYDPYGWSTSVGVGSGSTGWFSNIFMASAKATIINAVSFYTPVYNSTYELWVYSNVTPNQPRSGRLVRTTAGTLAKPGYHTVSMVPAVVASQKPFSVVVQLTTPGSTFPIAVENSSGGASAASSCAGQSFTSRDGTEWWDASSTYNVCLKAFATRKP
jgi:C1A family cysteine protease